MEAVLTGNLQIAPGKLARDQAWVGAVVAALFLVFGAVFAFVVLGDSDQVEGGMRVLLAMFFVIWTVVCGSMLIFFVRVGSNRQDNSVLVLKADGSEPQFNPPPGDDG